MDSLVTLQNHRRPLHLPVNHFPSPSKPPSSLSFRSQLPISPPSFASPPPSSAGTPRRRRKPSFPQILHPISLSILKTTSLAFAAAAALFFIRFSGKPAIAAPIPPPTVQSTKESKDDEDNNDIEAFGPLMVVRSKHCKFPEYHNNLERFIELDPNELKLAVLRAYIVGDPESAKKEFEKILAKDPFEFRAYQGLLMVTESSDTDSLKAILNRAERALENCKKCKKKLVVRRFKLLIAWIKVMTGSYSEALSDYQELEREEPLDFWPYLCQGIVYALLGKFDEVGKPFEMFERLFPNQPDKSYFREGM